MNSLALVPALGVPGLRCAPIEVHAPVAEAPLAVLIIEDCANDADLMLRQLRRSGFDVSFRRVETAAEMQDALREGAWQVVLCDFNLPGFDAGTALALLQDEEDLDIPFIVVSGVVPEGTAIELMRAGARDYVMKDDLGRLGAAVRREIAEARERAAAAQAERESEARLQSIADAALDAIVAIDENNDIRFFSGGAETMFGYAAAEVLGQPTTMLLPEMTQWRDGDGFRRYLNARRDGAIGRVSEHVARRRNGEVFPVELSLSTAQTQGKLLFSAFVRDITERKQAEQLLRESESRFRTMLEQNVSAMFMVEDGILTYANIRTGEILGYAASELVGCRFLDLIAAQDRDCIAQELQALLANAQESIERSFAAVRKDGAVVSIGVSATRTILNGKVVILGSAQDNSEREQAQREIDRYILRLEGAMEGTLEAVTAMVDLRDPYTAGHERRVGALAAAIATNLGFSAHAVKGIRLTGFVHDIGKISIPAELLSKPSRLTPTEYELIKIHSQAGYDVLKDVDFPWPVAMVILQHHERLDGSGYPHQLRGEEIIIEARILSVADVVEAMASHRPYRPGLGIDAALAEIERGRGITYDAAVVDVCLALFREQGYSFAD